MISLRNEGNGCPPVVVFQTTFETYEEETEVETDEEVEEIVEKEVVKDVVQEIKVPQVKALHPFSGQGLKMAKGEVGRLIRLNSKVRTHPY